jgi:triosephosphate isomerase
MKKLLIANWKCYKTLGESLTWIDQVGTALDESESYEVVVCPPFPYLTQARMRIEEKGYALKLGAQNVSHFEEGAFTGEVSARMVTGLVEYALIGHSERRQHFGETNEQIGQKVALSRKYSVEPLVLVRGDEDSIPVDVAYFAWEPVSAIGTGNAIDAATASAEFSRLTKGREGLYGMYGGSVNPSNVASFMHSPAIYGVVVGSASLNPVSFLEMIHAVY